MPEPRTPMFGMYLPQVSMSFPTIVTRVLAAEEAGFDSVWFMDHMATPMAPQRDSLEGWTLVSALGSLTSTVRLGHLVLCDKFRHPALLAKMAATLDVLALLFTGEKVSYEGRYVSLNDAICLPLKGMSRNGPWLGGRVDGRPSEIFREHVYVAPYHEENIPALVDLIGADRVLLGSDFPHPEGLAHPRDFAAGLSDLPTEDVRRIMRDNGRELVGLGV